MRRAIISLVIIIFVTLFLPINAGVFAAPSDPTPGTLTIHIENYEGEDIVGAGFAIYQIATLASDNGHTSFVPTTLFADYKGSLPVSMTAGENQASAESLVQYIGEKKISGLEVTTDADGEAVLSDLNPGLYLIRQTVSVEGYDDIDPFLVALPITSADGRTLLYDVTVAPKIGSATTPTDPTDPTSPTDPTTPTDPTSPTNPTTPTDPTSPTNPTSTTVPDDQSGTSTDTITGGGTKKTGVLSSTKLPQTGLLVWPIITLAVVGCILLIAGWADLNLRRRQK